ncbi:MAG: hypothetical protein QOE64_534 [Frankiales bacterium]|nr:hypothetical protein [Frankiales bacterium]
MRPLAVIDIDGVLADVRHRLHHLQQRPKDWDAFFAAAADDPPLEEGLAVVRKLAADHDVVYLTGRPERLRAVTERWLEANSLPRGELHMRKHSDRRPARFTKPRLLEQLARRRSVAVVVDDDLAVCAAYEAAGFPVLRAEWMVEEPTLFDAQEQQGRT